MSCGSYRYSSLFYEERVCVCGFLSGLLTSNAYIGSATKVQWSWVRNAVVFMNEPIAAGCFKVYYEPVFMKI